MGEIETNGQSPLIHAPIHPVVNGYWILVGGFVLPSLVCRSVRFQVYPEVHSFQAPSSYRTGTGQQLHICVTGVDSNAQQDEYQFEYLPNLIKLHLQMRNLISD